MKNQLPMFEGAPVNSANFRLSGKSAERVGSLDVGEEVFLTVKAYVSGVNPETTEADIELVLDTMR